MTFNEYQALSARTRTGDLSHQEAMVNALFGVAGEAGELVDDAKKAIFHGHELLAEDVANEIGDILWYLAWYADLHGLSLDECAAANVQKLRERYPDGFDPVRSQEREV